MKLKKKRQKKRSPDVHIRARLKLVDDDGSTPEIRFDFLMPENATVERLKVKIQLLTQDDELVSDELAVSVIDDDGEHFLLDDDHSCGDLPFSSKGPVQIYVTKARPTKKSTAAAIATANVPVEERVDYVTSKFEEQFRTCVQFRLDDYLWEQEALLEKQSDMTLLLREDVEMVVQESKRLREEVDEAVSLRKSLITRKVVERAEEASGSARKEIEMRKLEYAKKMSAEEKMNASIQQRLRERLQFNMYVFGGFKYLVWCILFSCMIFQFSPSGYETAELVRQQYMGSVHDLKV